VNEQKHIVYVCVCARARPDLISCSVMSTVVDTVLLNSVLFITYGLSANIGLESIVVREIGSCMRQILYVFGHWTLDNGHWTLT
jgi:hypothetical protein